MSNDVKITMTSEQASLLSGLDKLHRKIESTDRRMERLAKTSRSGSDKAVSGFRGQAVALGKVAAGYLGVASSISIALQANEQFRRSVEEASDRLDDKFRRFSVQAGFGAMAPVETQRAITSIATEQAIPTDVATDAATQLVSSGFTAEEASGGSLREFLKVLNATNARGPGVDPAEMAKALASYLESQGLDKTGENVAEVGQSIQRLFAGTNLQLSAMPQLAKHGAALKGAMETAEQLAAFSTLLDELPDPSTAATGLRNFAVRLQSAERNNTRDAAIREIGLTPEQIDFVGEDLRTVLDRIAAGLDTVEERKRPGVLSQLFGEEALSAAGVLLQKRETVSKALGIQQDKAGFESDVAVAISGRNAAKIRLTNERDQLLAEKNFRTENLELAAEVRALKAGANAEQVAVARMVSPVLRLASGMFTGTDDRSQAAATQVAFAATGAVPVMESAEIIRDVDVAERRMQRVNLRPVREQMAARQPVQGVPPLLRRMDEQQAPQPAPQQPPAVIVQPAADRPDNGRSEELLQDIAGTLKDIKNQSGGAARPSPAMGASVPRQPPQARLSRGR